MSLAAKLLKTDGTEEELVPKNGTDFSLQEIHDILGCATFELLQGGKRNNNLIMLVDEDGIEKQLARNQKASEYWANWNKPCPATYILGNVILCSEEMVK